MTPNHSRNRARLSLQHLEDRTTPAIATYAAATQTLTIVAAEGDRLLLEAQANQPAGYIHVTETQATATVFDSTLSDKAVRNVVLKFGAINSGAATLDAGLSLGGNLTLFGARATQTLSLLGTIGGKLTYTSNVLPALDEVNFAPFTEVAGNVSLNLGQGANIARLKGGLYQGNFLISAGAGNDTVELAESFEVNVYGSLTMRLGAGNNLLQGKGPSGIVKVGTNFSYTGGTGNDKIDLDSTGVSILANGDVKFSLGSPMAFDSNEAKFEAVRAGRNISVIGGLGTDTIKITGAISAGGNVKVALGDGDNTFDTNADNNANNWVGGTFTYAGGINGDVVNMDAITIGRNMNITLGENGGAGQSLFAGLSTPTGVTVFGSAKVTGGSGDEGMLFRRFYVGGSLTVNTFAGNDTVTFDDTDVVGRTSIDLGAGNDLFQSELLTGDIGGPMTDATTFGGVFTLKAGAGDDEVHLSDDSNATTCVKFGSQAILISGSGMDTLGNGPENEYKVTNNVNDFNILFGGVVPV